jgi:hypothetical protein
MATVDSFMMIVDTMKEEMFTDIKTKFYVLQSKVIAASIERLMSCFA